MNKNLVTAAVMLAACLTWHPARSQTVAKDQAARCEKEVRDYLQAMQFIRTTAGSSIGDRVAAGVASEQNVQKIAEQQGHCAAAQYIRERTAKR